MALPSSEPRLQAFRRMARTSRKRMMTSSTLRGIVTLFLVLATLGCGGSGLDGEYAGRIGDKMEVSLVFSDDGQVELRGYWPEPLNGSYEKAFRAEKRSMLWFSGDRRKRSSSSGSCTQKMMTSSKFSGFIRVPSARGQGTFPPNPNPVFPRTTRSCTRCRPWMTKSPPSTA